MSDARLAGLELLTMKLNTAIAQERIRRIIAQSPARARQAVANAAAWWQQQAVPHIPISSGRSRGQLRRRTMAWVRGSGMEVEGGLRSLAPYALWLAAGTRRIAGGRLIRWKLGSSPITTWKAKQIRQGLAVSWYGRRKATLRGKATVGLGDEYLPILLPWFLDARKRVTAELKGDIANA